MVTPLTGTGQRPRAAVGGHTNGRRPDRVVGGRARLRAPPGVAQGRYVRAPASAAGRLAGPRGPATTRRIAISHSDHLPELWPCGSRTGSTPRLWYTRS